MNETISPSITTSLLGIGAPGAGTGLLSTGGALTGLSGAFSQLLAQSAPGATPAAGGQSLPASGTSLPQGGNAASNQVLASLERLMGGRLPEDFVQQIQQHGFSEKGLEEAIQLLEQSSHAQVPAIGELVGQLRQVLKEQFGNTHTSEAATDSAEPVSNYSESQLPEVRSESTPSGALESAALVEGDDTSTKPESVRAATQVDPNVPLIQNAEVAEATRPNDRLGEQANSTQSLDPVRTASAIGGGSPGAVSAAVSTEQVMRTEQSQGVSGAERGLENADENSGSMQTIQRSGREHAQSQLSSGERTPVANSANSQVGEAKSGAEPKVINADIAALIKKQEAQVATASDSIQSDAERLMSRLSAAAQSTTGVSTLGRTTESTADTVLGAAVSRGNLLATGTVAAKESGGPGHSDTQAGQLEQVRQLVSQLTRVLQPAANTGQVVSNEQAVVTPPAQMAAAGTQAAPVMQTPAAGGDVSPEQAAAAMNQIKTDSAEDKRARREPTVIINADSRPAGEGGSRPSAVSAPQAVVADGDVAEPRVGMTARDDVAGRENSNSQGMNQSAAVASRQSNEQAQAQQPPLQFGLPGRPALNSPTWSTALGNQMVWLASQNNKVAEIQLDPPELGSLQVKIRVSQDQVSVSFVSPHASVRDTVEQSMARLREMFDEQGLNLADASVADQSTNEQSHEHEQGESGAANAAMGAESGEEDAGPMQAHSVSLVDYYA